MKMKSRRRCLALLVAFIMLTGALPVTAFAEGHTHTEECYAKAGDLLCTIAESEGHTHTAECVCPGGEYVCGLEEQETHEHTAECVCPGGEYICGLEEDEGHTHSEDCYARGGELICGADGLDAAAEEDQEAAEQDQKAAEQDQDQEIGGNASGTAWTYSQYYVEYSGLSASNKSRYQLDIIGNGVSTTQKVKYQFQFHNSEDYQAGDVKIYLPYALYQDRSHKGVTPSQIGVPKAPAVSADSDFHYSIETVDGEQLLCFTNSKDMKSGIDNVVQIMYALNDMDTVDGTSWEIVPRIVVKGVEAPEEKLGKTLTGSMDTEAHLTMTDKAAYSGSNAYLPQLYTVKQVKNWTGRDDITEADLDENYYLVWRTVVKTSASQPWMLEITDEPSDGGKVIKQFATTASDIDSVIDDTYSSESSSMMVTEQKSYGETYYVYTVTAYPKETMPEDLTVENTITVTLTGSDDHKTETRTDTAKWTWQAYEYKPRKGQNYIYKRYGSNLEDQTRGVTTKTGWLDVYRESVAQGSDLALPESWHLTYVAEWYDKIYENPNYSYHYALIDDLQFACGNGQYQQMSYEDYYYKNIRFSCIEKNLDLEDIYDKKYVRQEDGEPFVIYVMTVASPNVWQKVDEVAFTEINDYKIPQKYYDEEIYRIKAEHKGSVGESRFTISSQTVLRADSPLLNSFLEDHEVSSIQILNFAGGVSVDNEGNYYTDDGAPYGHWPTTTNVDLDAFETENYGCKRIRDYDYLTLKGIAEASDAVKTARMENDAVNGRVGITYTLAGWDGYKVYDKDIVSILESSGVSPEKDRNQVTMYDLLPLGVTFDASKSVTVGSLIGTKYTSVPGAWDKSDVSVSYTVTDNYRGSGRQMITFTITYTGDGNAFCDRPYGESDYKWGCGYGIEFSAYYLWKDYDLANAGVNVMAYATPTRIKGNGYTDDGTGAPIATGTDSDGKSYFYDPEGDGVSDIPYILYAQAANNSEIALAAQANIKKTVKADADIFGEPGTSASVLPGETYTYRIQVTNSSEELHDLIVYDHLENASKERADAETGFDEDYWQGTFESVDLSAVKAKGIDAVVYYSANREQEMDIETDGWVKADDWTLPLSDVKSVAFDLRKTTEGEEFVLNPLASVKVSIKMRAPEEMQLPAVYAYNNPAFYCYFKIGETGTETEPELVIGDSVRVKLYDKTSLAVEKKLAEGSETYEDSSFTFKVEIDGALWANKEYTLYIDGTADGKVHATDKNGQLSLKAGQYAVFDSVPTGAEYTVTELSGNNWMADGGAVRTGTLQSGAGATASFTNRYSSLLYVEKHIQYEQDYTPNADTFTFRLLLNGKPAANVEYALVERSTSYAQDPTVIENGLVTDADGCFVLTASQRAMFRVKVGTGYTLKELTTRSDYICDQPEVTGTVKGDASLAYITNNYKYKDLYIVKEIVTPDGVDAPADYAYTFTLTLDGALAANQPYELYQLTENEDTGAVRYEKVADKLTDANGRFTLTPSQYARITHLTAGAAYTVTEDTDRMPENVRPYGEAKVSGTLPQYAPSKTATIQNRYLRQALEVSKTVLSDDGQGDDREFTFTIKVNDQLYVNQTFSHVDKDGDAEQDTTDALGTFTLRSGEKAVFQQLMAGDTYEVTETPDQDYVQILPADNAAATGTITDDLSAANAKFMNAVPGSSLWVTKSVQSEIEGLAEDSLWGKKYAWEGGKYVEKWVYGGTKFRFYVEVNGQPYANQRFTVIADDGTTTTAMTSSDGYFDMNATQKALFSNLNPGDSYKVYERSTSRWDYGDGWHESDAIYSDEGAYIGTSYWRQIIPANTGDADGVIGDDPQAASFTNEYTLTNRLYIRKMINGGWPSDQEYEGTATLKLKLTLRDKDGNLFTGPDTVVDHSSLNDGSLEISDDGTITITTTSLGDLCFDLYIPFGYDFKLEEVGAEPESVLGVLSAIAIEDNHNRDGNYAPTIDEAGFVITTKTPVSDSSSSTDFQLDIYNTNTQEKFRVYKQAEGGNTDQDFEFTLYKSDVLIYNLQDIFSYNEDTEADYNFVPMPNEAYDVYDTASGELVAQRTTDANGQFTLKGGQYAEFTGYRCRKDDGPDGYWSKNPDANDIIYKVVETPYADYVPQVTILHSTTKRGEWHNGYRGEDGKWVPGYYEYITSETTRTDQANGGSMLAGDRITFTNTYGNSSSLIISKKVTARDGVKAPVGDEFTFKLTVEGKPYANQTYTRYGSNNEQITNVQKVKGADGNEYEVELPWTTDAYGQFQLKAGEHAVFDWVGEGKSYTVTEEPKADYTQVTPAAGTGISDVITASGAVAEFVNLYNRNPMTDGTTLTIQKLLALPYGLKTAPEENFTFRVKIDGEAYAQKPYSVYTAAGELVTANGMTDENGELKLTGGQYAVLTQVPAEVDYEVTELLADGSAYTALGNTKHTGVTKKDGTVETFTNAFGNLLVSKQVQMEASRTAPEEDTFRFVLTLDGKAGANLSYWIMNADNEKIGEESTAQDGSFRLHADEAALFYGLQLGSNYQVKEYGKTYYTQTVPVRQDGYSGEIGSTAPTLRFVNEYSRSGALEISKQVVDKNGMDVSCDTAFNFRVTIGGKVYADKPYVIYGADGYKKVGIYTTTADGIITLSSGERAVMTGVLPGAKYRIEEVSVPEGYMPKQSVFEGTVSQTGTAAAFVNVREKDDEPGGQVGSLTVSKVVAGNAGDTKKDFSFTVKLGDSTVSGRYGDMTFANGTATFTLKHNEKKTATGLPAGTSYEVTEGEANQDGYTTTATGANGSIVKDQTATAAFTNAKNSGGGGHDGENPGDDGYGNLTVSKTVSGTAGDTAKAFTFTIKLDPSISGTYGDVTFDKGMATITLKHGESKTAKSLPSGIHYSVTESDNEGYTVSTAGDRGSIGDGKTVVAAFTNSKDDATVTPDNPDHPANPDMPDTANRVAKTGDESKVGFWLALMISSFAAFTGVCLYRRKRADG